MKEEKKKGSEVGHPPCTLTVFSYAHRSNQAFTQGHTFVRVEDIPGVKEAGWGQKTRAKKGEEDG